MPRPKGWVGQVTPKGDELLIEARLLCAQLSAGKEYVADTEEKLACVWSDANTEGVTRKKLADECGVSEQQVNKMIARARGRAWAR